MSPMHVCAACFTDSASHPPECYQDECGDGAVHWPALCCPGCPCRSFEDAHPVPVHDADGGAS